MLEPDRDAVGVVERSAVRGERRVHTASIVVGLSESRGSCYTFRVRAGALVLFVAAVATLGAGAGTAGTAPALRLQVSFSGAAQGTFRDVERWTSLSTNQCVLRRSRDETVNLSWSYSWRGASGGRPGQAAAPTAQGAVAGTEVRDSCDIAPAELPSDAPADWMRSVTCNDPLEAEGSATLVVAQRTKQMIVQVALPEFAVSPDAECTAYPRSDQLRARVPLELAALKRLRPGASLSFTVGSAVTRFGAYAPQHNCMHAAKPYDGYRSYDECLDLLTWSGTLRVTRV